MERIRVLQFSLANGNGGRSNYTLNNWKYIDRERFLFDFVTFDKEYLLEDELTEQGCTVHHFSCYRSENENQFAKEWRHILSNGYDIVHLNTSYWESMLLEEIAMEMGVKKVIIHSHNSGIGTATDPERLEHLTKRHYEIRRSLNERKATDFWACSWEAAEWLFGDLIPRERIVIMKNAIQLERFRYDITSRQRTRMQLGFDDEDYVVGSVGRFVLQKNYSFLIQVIADCIKTNPHIKLLLRGEGKLEDKLIMQIKELGVYENIKFMPRPENISDAYNAFDCFALPSLFEGFPLCVVEAQVSGMQVICSDRISREVNCTGKVEYLPLETEEWVQAILGKTSEKKGRESCIDEMKACGFDIKDQIKIIERAYSN